MTTGRYTAGPRRLATSLATNLAAAPPSEDAACSADPCVGESRGSVVRPLFRPDPPRASASFVRALRLGVAEDEPEGRPRDRDLLAKLRELPAPPKSVLRRVFELTPAEARLAQKLACGDSLEQVAQSLDVKMTTARSQLAAIFAKTATCRQAQLVAILSRLAHLA